jgi:polyisoprenoid-binding protein YceI
MKRLLLVPAALSLMAAQWVIDDAKSTLTYDAVQEGTPFTGKLNFDANIQFDPGTLKGTSIQVNILLEKADAGSSDRNETLATPEFFNIAKHPTATFTSTEVTKSANGYVAHGMLTIKNIGKNIDLPFTLKKDGEDTIVDGVVDLSRKTFEVGTGEWADEETIGDKVTVKLHLVARPKD